MSLSKLSHHHRQPSSPPPPSADELSDLCLLALFSQMTVRDRLSASQVCPQWQSLMREVTKTLTIAIVDKINEEEESLKSIQRRINRNTAGSVFADYLLTVDNHQSQHHHSTNELPLSQWHRLTPFNTLTLSVEQLNSATFREQITSAFADLTALTYARPEMCFFSRYQCLLTFLQDLLVKAKGWRRQLRSLSLLGGMDDHLDEGEQVERLFASLKEMSSLRYLTLEYIALPSDLSVLAHLKEITLRRFSITLSFPTLYRYVQEGGGRIEGPIFKVDLFDGPQRDAQYNAQMRANLLLLHQLDDHLCDGITNLGSLIIYHDHLFQNNSLVRAFPRLTSLTLNSFSHSYYLRIFPIISQHLKQLSHLIMYPDYSLLHVHDGEEEEEGNLPPFPPPPLSAPLPSVRLLELHKVFFSSSHSADLHFLNLRVTMPNLQAILVSSIGCRQCNRPDWYNQDPSADSPTVADTYRCYRAVFEALQRITSLPRSRLLGYHFESYFTAEQLEPLAN